MSLPIIDVSEIGNPTFRLKISKQITEACSKWGFLLLQNHSIPPAEIDEMFSIGREFFNLPEHLKKPWPINHNSVGYSGSFTDRLKDDKMSMWFGGAPGSLSNHPEALPPFWHDHIAKIDKFKHKCHDLVLQLLVCFAIAMELPDPSFFSSRHNEGAGNGNTLRMIMYPAREEQSILGGTRLSAHTDSGSVTLLFQRQAGLEVLSPQGEWVQAPCMKDCILVNIGDALSFWSGMKLKATMHRVTFDSLPYGVERQTMAYFGKADSETKLEPIAKGFGVEGFVSNGIPLTPGMTVGDLGEMIMSNIYGTGKVAEAQKI